MLSSLCQGYRIPGASVARWKILSYFIAFWRLHAAPWHQQMADLPQDIVSTDEPPFTRVGVEFVDPSKLSEEGVQ